jgi:hypothetical protein
MARAAKSITSQFEQMLLDASKEHGFTAVSAGFNSHVSVGRWWSVNVHWDGFSRDGNSCAGGSGNSIPEALAKALHKAAAKRVPFDANAKIERVERLRAELAALEAGPVEQAEAA